MIDIKIVFCSWCDYGFEIDVNIDNSKDDIICPKCNKKSNLWADGDIDFNAYYLTRNYS